MTSKKAKQILDLEGTPSTPVEINLRISDDIIYWKPVVRRVISLRCW